MARYDLQPILFDRSYLLDYAHAQESSTLDRMLADLAAGDLLLADRHDNILQFLRDVDEKEACFLIRSEGKLIVLDDD